MHIDGGGGSGIDWLWDTQGLYFYSWERNNVAIAAAAIHGSEKSLFYIW